MRGVWYQSLTKDECALYQQLLEGAQDVDTDVGLGVCKEDELWRAYRAMVAEHPELFWLDGYKSIVRNGEMTVRFDSSVSQSSAGKLAEHIERAVDEALAGIPDGASSYEKVRYCYEWIVEHTDYESSGHDQIIQGVPFDHKAVCVGYTSTLQYSLHRLGIPCDLISGEVPGRGRHSWNLVWLVGVPTYVDVTWGDQIFVVSDGTQLPADEVCYNNLCVTTEEIEREHTVNRQCPNLPLCDSQEYDYYQLNGTYLKRFDEDGLQHLVDVVVSRKESPLRFKLSDRTAYKEALSFGHPQDVFACLPEGVGSISIGTEEELYIIGIEWRT